MKILTAAQIKELDHFTILHEPVSSIDLMERAGHALFDRINLKFSTTKSFLIFCGPGNNGGDGLVLARLFKESNRNVEIVILKANYTSEFNENFQKIKDLKIKYTEIENLSQIEALHFNPEHCFIDALFGTGITRPIEGVASALVKKINEAFNFKIAIDIPSGLSPDCNFISTKENTVKANCTLSIQLPKLAFFFSENHPFVGSFECIDIGLSRDFIEKQIELRCYLDSAEISALIKPRETYSHKRTFGHALIMAGSEGKTGASILAAKAALKTGCGLVTAYIPREAISPLLSVLPEAMIITGDDKEKLKQVNFSNFYSIGFGPGIGFEANSSEMLFDLLNNYHLAFVIDADGLTLLSQNKNWYSLLQPNIILTPHPGEFDRLARKHDSGFERFKTQLDFSKKHKVTILLKGHHTSITTPDGMAYFNSTGNNGMATAGSGDVLTGIITSLCAQGYSTIDAAILGVYLHGYAGDSAAAKKSKSSMIASDIIDGLADFFLSFEK